MKTSILIMAGLLIATPMIASADDAHEKCYGVAKAGKNDCASKIGGNSCAGQTTKDGQGFIVVPKGLCTKLTGGKIME